jgi:DNA-binding NarL/FixJ family response regulator
MPLAMIRIIIADDHKVFREGIVSLLEDIPDIETVGQAADGPSTLQLLAKVKPHIVLMDVALGTSSGIATTQAIKKKCPEVKVLALSMHSESQYIVKMLEAGASGYLLKDAGSAELISAIRTVHSGDSYYSRQVSEALIDHLAHRGKTRTTGMEAPISKRETEVLRLIAEEYSNAEIAGKLYISIRTVDTHRRNLLEKLGAKNTAGLVKHAIRLGLIEG